MACHQPVIGITYGAGKYKCLCSASNILDLNPKVDSELWHLEKKNLQKESRLQSEERTTALSSPTQGREKGCRRKITELVPKILARWWTHAVEALPLSRDRAWEQDKTSASLG